MAKSTEYQKDLIEALKDPCEAAAYLNAAIEEGEREVFLLALRNVAEAQWRNWRRCRQSQPEPGKYVPDAFPQRKSGNQKPLYAAPLHGFKAGGPSRGAYL